MNSTKVTISRQFISNLTIVAKLDTIKIYIRLSSTVFRIDARFKNREFKLF